MLVRYSELASASIKNRGATVIIMGNTGRVGRSTGTVVPV
jgi:hypothetical protein